MTARELVGALYVGAVMGAFWVYDRIENRLRGHRRPAWTWGGRGVSR